MMTVMTMMRTLIMTCTCTEDRLSDSHIPYTYVLDFVYEF